MFTYRLTLLLLIAFVLSAKAQQSQPDTTKVSPRIIFTVVQEHPHFPGGIDELGKYLRKNTRYPEAARKKKKKGVVFVNFIVTDKGLIEDVQVLKGLTPELDAEAVRVVQEMPTWVPGRQSGKAVNCRYNLPIHFD